MARREASSELALVRTYVPAKLMGPCAGVVKGMDGSTLTLSSCMAQVHHTL